MIPLTLFMFMWLSPTGSNVFSPLFWDLDSCVRMRDAIVVEARKQPKYDPFKSVKSCGPVTVYIPKEEKA